MNYAKEQIRVLVGTEPPGGATCLFPVVVELRRRGLAVTLLAAGPAMSVFRQNGVRFLEAGSAAGGRWDDVSIRRWVQRVNPDVILTGVVGPVESGLDYRLIRAAKSLGLPHMAVLDAWMKYPERFADPATGDPLGLLPDVLAVMDAETRRELICLGIPPDRMIVTGHPMVPVLRSMAFEAPTSRRPRGGSRRFVLFLSEPIRWVEATYGTQPVGYDELEVFSLFARAVESAAQPCQVIIKEHPRHASLADAVAANRLPVVIDADTDVFGLIADADVVVGMSSTLLVWSYLLGKQVLCVQPGLNRRRDCNMLTRRGVLPVLESVEEVADGLSCCATSGGGTLEKVRADLGWNARADVTVADCVIGAAQQVTQVAGALT